MSENQQSTPYIRLPRSLLKDPLWVDLPLAYQNVFIVLVERVCFKPQKFDDHGVLIDLLPGQICVSERDLLKFCNKYVTRNDIQRSIKKFILYDFVSQEVIHKKSIITITHKDTYNLIIKSCEPTSEPNLSQTRAKLEPESNKDNKEEKEENNKTIAQSTSSFRKKGNDIYFSFDERKFFNILESDMSAWRTLYPAVPIEGEINRMIQWILANPTRAKKNWRKFIFNWLEKSNEKFVNLAAYRAARENPSKSAVVNHDKRTNPKFVSFVEEV